MHVVGPASRAGPGIARNREIRFCASARGQRYQRPPGPARLAGPTDNAPNLESHWAESARLLRESTLRHGLERWISGCWLVISSRSKPWHTGTVTSLDIPRKEKRRDRPTAGLSRRSNVRSTHGTLTKPCGRRCSDRGPRSRSRCGQGVQANRLRWDSAAGFAHRRCGRIVRRCGRRHSA